MLIVISGLPGTGKTAVAAGIAARLNAVHLSIDPIEDAMLGAGLPPGWLTGVAAYEATRAAADQNLTLGHDVIVDAVNDSEPARQTWRHSTVEPRFVLLTCPDRAEHRRRLESRRRNFRHLPEPTWAEVESRSATYEPWTDQHLLIDSRPPLQTVIETTHQQLTNPR